MVLLFYDHKINRQDFMFGKKVISAANKGISQAWEKSQVVFFLAFLYFIYMGYLKWGSLSRVIHLTGCCASSCDVHLAASWVPYDSCVVQLHTCASLEWTVPAGCCRGIYSMLLVRDEG